MTLWGCSYSFSIGSNNFGRSWHPDSIWVRIIADLVYLVLDLVGGKAANTFMGEFIVIMLGGSLEFPLMV